MANAYYATAHAKFYNQCVRDAWIRQMQKLSHVDCVSDRYEKDYLYRIQALEKIVEQMGDPTCEPDCVHKYLYDEILQENKRLTDALIAEKLAKEFCCERCQTEIRKKEAMEMEIDKP